MKKMIEFLWFAATLALPFIWPVYFWPLILLAYSPFFAIALNSKAPFLEITAWYTLFMMAHTTALFLSLSPEECSFSLFVCLMLLSFFIALQTGLWFYLLSQSIRFFHYILIKRALICIALFIFFLFFDRALFWFFGAFQGYSLLHPLLPLSCFSPCAHVIAWWGESSSLIVLIGCAMLFSFLHQKSKKKYRGVTLFLSLLGIVFSFLPIKKQKEKNPLWLSRIAFAQTSQTPQTAYDKAQEIKGIVADIIDKQAGIDVVIFPESTFCYSLCHYPSSLALLAGVLPQDKKIIFGAHQKVDQKLFSCCFVVDHNGIAYCYKKKKLLFFAEEIPSFFIYFSCFKQLFLGTGPVFYPAEREQEETMPLFDNLVVTPSLCSELFLGHKKNTDAVCILALVNDKRFSYGPFCDLLYKTACLKSLLWRQSILYAGYSHQIYISSY